MSKNKVILSTAITGLLLFVGTNSMAATGVINTETVKMRSEASTESKVVTLVSEDDKVEIIEKTGDWYKVKFDGKTGYIYAEYVDNKDEKTTENTVAENTLNENSTNTTSENDTNTNTEDTTTTSEDKTEEVVVSSDVAPINSQIKTTADIEIKIIPLINADVIGSVLSNTTITILDYINGWYYVSSDSIEGWVREEKIDVGNVLKTENTEQKEETEAAEDTSEEKENKEEKTVTKYVSTEKLNIRKEASTDSEVLKSLVLNTAVNVISTENGWSKVKVGNVEGYVSSKYLSDEKVKETSNTVTDRNMENSRATETATAAPASSGNSDVVSYAKQYLGASYVSGGAGPNSFDCSGFTQYVYKNYGVSLAHSASGQAGVGTAVDKSNLQPGDLVIFNGESNSSIGHVGIYIGDNQFIHASNPKGGVKITSMSTGYYSSRYVTARRVL